MNSPYGSHPEKLPDNGKGRYETKEMPSAEVDKQISRIRWKLILREFAKVYIISLAIFMVIASACFIGVQSLLSKVEYATEEDMVIPDDLDNLYVKPAADEQLAEAATLTEEDMAATEEQLEQIALDENGLRYEEGVTNILLLGTDGRKASSKNARSDAIIILSINENTQKLVMSSIMRDTYVNIPGRKENEKITHAHVYGGPALSMQTVEENFGIRIDHFAAINFYAFMDIVDALGGVDVP
ncbi:MAG: hypothetical protein E7559_10200, partial [Ruminococcaceae bacterium]|nr:hypothetical protein [Oscillospiraceae bacterium]